MINNSFELNRVYQVDCVEGMKLLPENYIDLTVTSPPYDNLRKYNGYSFNFEGVADELFRITKQGGVVVWVVSDKTVKGSETGTSFNQALYFKKIGFNLHDTMIYAKNNPTPQFRNMRYNQAFEYMFVFSKGKINTCNYLTEPTVKAGEKKSRKRNSESSKQSKDVSRDVVTVTKEEKIKNNIWFYNVGINQSSKDYIAFKHPAIFPEKLAEDHILSWSNEGDLILDPFMGSGTTAKISSINKRNWIGFELSPDYIEIANKRLDSLNQK
jgi:DNA modification methylase